MNSNRLIPFAINTYKALRFVTTGLIALALFLTGCENEENYTFEDTPIIAAYLHEGDTFEVQIQHQVPFLSEAEFIEKDLDDLLVYVSKNGVQYQLTATGNGVYTSNSFEVSAGDDYTLTLNYNQKEVSAYTYIPSKPSGLTQSATIIYVERRDSTSVPSMGSMPDPIEITWENDDDSYYLVVIENIESELDPIQDFGDDDAPERQFRNAPTNTSAVEIRPFDFQYFGHHQVIIYHVLPDYASLYEMSENSSQNITNPSTCIENGYGIFTGLNSDTLYVNVKED